jgi:hypothetical protein
VRLIDRDFVVIAGAPRSGTSWVGKIFDSHPDVLYRNEPDTVLNEDRLPFLILPGGSDPYVAIAADYMDRMLRTPTVKSAGHVPNFPKSYFRWGLGAVHAGIVHVARMLAAGPNGARLAARRLPDLVDIDANRELHLVVKTVSAQGRLEAFLRAAPRMRVVCLLRHPCGQASSMLRGMRVGKLPKREPFIDDVLATPAASRYGLTREGLMAAPVAEQWAWNWVAMNELALAAAAGHPHSMVMTYESLCADPAGGARQLFAFAGLAWNPQSEEFLQASTRGSGKARYHSVFRNTASAATKWRDELSVDEQRSILDVLDQSSLARHWRDLEAPVAAAS